MSDPPVDDLIIAPAEPRVVHSSCNLLSQGCIAVQHHQAPLIGLKRRQKPVNQITIAGHLAQAVPSLVGFCDKGIADTGTKRSHSVLDRRTPQNFLRVAEFLHKLLLMRILHNTHTFAVQVFKPVLAAGSQENC